MIYIVKEHILTRTGEWYRMCIMVHRTGESVIDGAVLTSLVS